MNDFFIKCKRDFVPAVLKERLRKDMNNMAEHNCKDLSVYAYKFRHLVAQEMREMSDLDRIMYFLRGVTGRTRKEAQFRRCTPLSDATIAALAVRGKTTTDSYSRPTRTAYLAS